MIETFLAYMERRLGTSKWVVARNSASLREKGYMVFLSQRRYTELRSVWASKR